MAKFENQITHEILECNNPREVEMIDGVEYLIVHRYGNDRSFLVKKDCLKKVIEPKKKTNA